MFEGLVAGLLNKYLGEFVHGISEKELSISVWGGKVELNNLKVKTSFLDDMGLPVAVKLGQVGKLLLSANWTSLGSEPVVVTLEDVYVIIGPRVDFQVDEKKAAAKALKNKLSSLKTMEEMKLSPELQAGDDEEEEKGMVARTAEKVVDNIQVTVKNIHVRYEDNRNPEHPFCFGICLKELSAFTTDSDWKRKFMKEMTKTHKKIVLARLALYFNVTGPGSKPVRSLEGLGDVFRQQESKNDTSQYILAPVSGELKVILNKKTYPAPKTWVSGFLKTLHIAISEPQYATVLDVLHTISDNTKASQLVETLFQERYRSGTSLEQKKYIRLYKRKLNAEWLDELEEEEEFILKEMEEELIYDDIAKWRLITIAELKKELGGKTAVTLRKPKEKKGYLSSLGGFLFGSGDKEKKGPVVVLSEAEKARLADEIDLVAEEKEKKLQSNLPDDYVNIEFGFGIRHTAVSLLDKNRKNLLSIESTDIKLKTIIRPNSLSAKFSLLDVVMNDSTTPGSLFPQVLKVVRSSSSSRQTERKSFIDVSFHQNPLDKPDADVSVAVAIQQLELIAHTGYISRVIKFFTPPKPVDFSAVSSLTADTMQQLQAGTAMSVTDAFKYHTSTEIILDVAAPTIVVVMDPKDTDKDVIVLDLGHMSLSSDLQSKATVGQMGQVLESLIEKDAKESKNTNSSNENGAIEHYDRMQDLRPSQLVQCFDQRRLALTNLQIMLVTDGPKWRSLGRTSHLLNPLQLELFIGQCVAPQVSWLPKMQVDGSMDIVDIHISTVRLQRLLQFVEAWSSLGQSADQSADSKTSQTLSSTSYSSNDNSQASSKKKVATDEAQGAGSTADDPDDQDEEQVLVMDDLVRELGSMVEAQRLIAEVDQDGDGIVTQAEFTAWKNKQIIKQLYNKVLSATFKMSGVKLTVWSDADVKNTFPVLEFSIDNMGLALYQQSYDLKIGVQIGGISLKNKMSRFGPVFRNIICTESALVASDIVGAGALSPTHHQQDRQLTSSSSLVTSDDSFIVVQFSNVSSEHPHFATQPHAVVDLKVGLLCLSVDPSTVLQVGSFFLLDFIPKPEPAPKPSTSSRHGARHRRLSESKRARRRSIQIIEDAKAEAKQLEEAERLKQQQEYEQNVALVDPEPKRARDAETMMKVSLVFSGIKVDLNSDNNHLASLAITGFAAHLSQYKHALSVRLTLNETTMMDLTPEGADYPAILSVNRDTSLAAQSQLIDDGRRTVGSQLIQVYFDTFSKDDLDYPGYPSELEARVRGLRFHFLNRFIRELTLFGTAGPLADFLKLLGEQHQPENNEDPSEFSAPGDGAVRRRRHSNALMIEPISDMEDHKQALQTIAQAKVEAQHIVEDAEKKAGLHAEDSFVKLVVDLCDVVTVVPLSSHSKETLSVSVDTIMLTNVLAIDQDSKEGLKYQSFNAKVNGVAVTTSIAPLRSQTIINQITDSDDHKNYDDDGLLMLVTHLVNIDTIQASVGLLTHREPKDVQVELNVGKINLSFSRAQFLFLIQLPNCNLKEDAVLLKEDNGELMDQIKEAANQAYEDAKEAAAVRAQELQASTCTNVCIRLEELDFELQEYDGNQDTDSLLFFHMGAIDLDLSANNDGSLVLALTLSGVTLDDTSTIGATHKNKQVLAPYKRTLGLAKGQAEDAPFPFSLFIDKTADDAPIETRGINIECHLIDLHLAFTAGLFQLPAFFAMPSAPVALPISPSTSLEDQKQDSEEEDILNNKKVSPQQNDMGVSAAAPDDDDNVDDDQAQTLLSDDLVGEKKQTVIKPVDQKLQRADKTNPIKIKLQMLRPLVLLVEDPTAESSSGISLTWNIDTQVLVDGDHIRVDTGLKDVSMLHTTLDASDGKGIELNTHEAVPIIAAFSILANVEMDRSPLVVGAQAMHVFAAIKPINIRLTYQDYRLVLNSLDALAIPQIEENKGGDGDNAKQESKGYRELQNEEHKQKLSPDGLTIELLDGSASDLPGGSTDSKYNQGTEQNVGTSGSVEEEELQVAEKEKKAPGFGDMTVDVKVDGVHVQLINDCVNTIIPIARADLSEIQAKIVGVGASLHLRSGFTLSMDYFNNQIVEWEPMLEPWAASILVHQQHHIPLHRLMSSPDTRPTDQHENKATELTASSSSSSSSAAAAVALSSVSTSVEIQASKPFNLNVAQAMIDGALDSIALLTSVEAKESKADNVTYSTYMFENLTEFPIIFFRYDACSENADNPLKDAGEYKKKVAQENKKKKDQNELADEKNYAGDMARVGAGNLSDWIRVPAFSSVPFDFPDSLPDRQHAIYLSYEDPNQVDLRKPLHFQVAKTFLTAIDAQVTDGNNEKQTIPILFSLDIVEGVKFLRAHSTTSMINQTASRLCIDDQSGILLSQDDQLLEPDQLLWMPLLLSHKHLVKVRPSEQHKWSSDLTIESKRIIPAKKSSRGTSFTSFLSSSPSDKQQRLEQSLFFECKAESKTVSDFSFSLSAIDLSDESSRSALAKSMNKMIVAGQVTVYSLKTPLVFTNLLPCAVDLKLSHSGQTGGVFDERIISRTETVPIPGASLTHGSTNWLSLSIPDYGLIQKKEFEALEYEDFTNPELLAKASKEEDRDGLSEQIIQLNTPNGRYSLNVHLECVFTQGSLHVTAYVPYWIYDLTDLELIITDDKKLCPPKPKRTRELSDLSNQNEKTENTANEFLEHAADNLDIRFPVMFSPFKDGQAGKIYVKSDRIASDWISKKVSIEAVGQVTAVEIQTKTKQVLEVGIQVNMALGPFYRTKVVKLSPALIIVNRLSCCLALRQFDATRNMAEKKEFHQALKEQAVIEANEQESLDLLAGGSGNTAGPKSGRVRMRSSVFRRDEIAGADDFYDQLDFSTIAEEGKANKDQDEQGQAPSSLMKRQTTVSNLRLEGDRFIVKAGAMCPLHWNDGDKPRLLSFRRTMDPDETNFLARTTNQQKEQEKEWSRFNWSGYVSASNAGETFLAVSTRESPYHTWFAKVEVRVSNATAFIIISELEEYNQLVQISEALLSEAPSSSTTSSSTDQDNLDELGSLEYKYGTTDQKSDTEIQPQQAVSLDCLAQRFQLPYVIENRSAHQTLRFRQVITKKTGKNGSHVNPRRWTVMPPCSEKAFAWEEPLHERRLHVEVGRVCDSFGESSHYQREFKWPLDTLQDLATFEVYMTDNSGVLDTGSVDKLYAFMENDGCTNVLVISDFPSSDVVPAEGENRKAIEKLIAGRKGQEIMLLRGLAEQVNQSLQKSLLYLETENDKRIKLKKAQVQRPAIAEHVSELRVVALTGSGFTSDQRIALLFHLGHHHIKSQDALGPWPVWNESFNFNTTGLSPNTILFVEAFYYHRVKPNQRIGCIALKLSQLNSYQPVEVEFKLRDIQTGQPTRGRVRLWLWNIPRAISFVDLNICLTQVQIREKQRVLQSVINRSTRLQPSSTFNILPPLVYSAGEEGIKQECRPHLLTKDLSASEIRATWAALARTLMMEAASSSFTFKLLDHQNLIFLLPSSHVDDKSSGKVVCMVECSAIQLQFGVDLGALDKDDEKEQDKLDQTVTFYIPDALLQSLGDEAKLRLTLHYFDDKDGEYDESKHDYEDTSSHILGTCLVPLNVEIMDELDIAIDEASNNNDYQDRDEKKAKQAENKVHQKHRQWVGISPSSSTLSSSSSSSSSPPSSSSSLLVYLTRIVAQSPDQRANMKLHLQIPLIGASIVDNTPKELLYLSVSHIDILVEDSNTQQTLEFIVGRIQLDNQSYNAIFPVVLAPSPVPLADLKPMVHLSVNKSKMINSENVDGHKSPTVSSSSSSSTSMHSFQYFSLLIQAVDVKVEEQLIWELLGYVSSIVIERSSTVSTTDYSVITYVTADLSQEMKIPESTQTFLYFQFLQIHPMCFTISLASNPGIRKFSTNSKSSMIMNPIKMVMSVAAATLGNLDAASIRLNGKVIENAAGTPETLIGSLVSYYVQQAVKQGYKIIGSVEVLGNPVGLVNNLGSGVADFFYEPAKGLVKSPKAFGKGLTKGTLSLLKNTVTGVFGAASKITGSLGKGVAALSMDDEFIAKNAQGSRDQAEHAAAGLVGGVKSLGKGIASGIAGVVIDPLKGAKQGGMKGFIKGIGKGIAGAVAKPTAGFASFVAKTFDGIANTANYIGGDKTLKNQRVRLPRYIDPESRQLVIYDAKLAEHHQPNTKSKKHKEKNKKHNDSKSNKSDMHSQMSDEDGTPTRMGTIHEQKKEEEKKEKNASTDDSNGQDGGLQANDAKLNQGNEAEQEAEEENGEDHAKEEDGTDEAQVPPSPAILPAEDAQADMVQMKEM